MTNLKATKRALGASILSIVLCLSMLMGTTFAWFTDTVTSGNNQIIAGNLDIELDYWNGSKWETVNGATELFTGNLWEPGHTEVVYLRMTNKGTLSLKYQLGINIASETAGTNVADATFKLSDYIYMGIVEDVNGENGAYETREDAIADAKANGTTGIIGKGYMKASTMTKQDEVLYMAVVVYMPENITNDANYKTGTKAPSIDLGINLIATQLNADVEYDSFDKDYDKNAWDDAMVVMKEDDLVAALYNGGKIVMATDITASETIEIPEGAEVTLDLAGKKLSADIRASDAKLTVINGTINNDSADSSAIEINAGTLVLDNVSITSARHAVRIDGEVTATINGGTYEAKNSAGKTQHALNVSGNANVTINGGTFIGPKGTASDSGAAVKVQTGAAVTINGGNFSGGKNNTLDSEGTLTVRSGTFDQNPSEYVADGYKAAMIGEVYYVTVKNADVAVDADSLNKALNESGDVAEGREVVLPNDLTVNTSETKSKSSYGATGITINGGVLDGNGNTLTVNDANKTWDSGINAVSGTIKNVTVNGSFRGIFMGGATGDVYIDNVVIDKVCYTFNSDAGNKDYGVYISNSTLNGWTSYSDVHKEVVFTNCNFGQGTGGYKYAFCRPYNASVFENCVFEEGFEFDTSMTSDILFINCYYGDTLITAENAATLGNGETTFFYNGIGKVKFTTDVADVSKALNEGKYAVLTGNATATEPVYVNGGTLNGNNNTLNFTGVKTSSWPNAYAVTLNNGGSTVENLTITNAGYALGSTAATEDIYIKNVTTDYCTYALNGNGNNTNSVYVTDSNLNGWISYSNIKLLSFDGCTLGKGNTNYAYLVVYGDTTFTDCTFEAPFSMCARFQDGAVVADGKTVTLTDCTYVQADGTSVKVTADNFASLFGKDGDEDFQYMEQVNVVIDNVAVSWN